MTAPAAQTPGLTEQGTQFAVRSYGRVDPSSVTTHAEQAAYVAHALGGDACVVTRTLFATPWADVPAPAAEEAAS